jgi:N-acetylglucosamine-6-sulfatase
LESIPEDTMVIFTSDHGYFYGEHCLSHERRLAYEETIRIPMLIRYPPLFKPGSKPADFFLSVDVRNLCLHLQLPKRRESILIEYFSDKVFPRIDHMGYKAVRTRRWKYIHYVDLANADELYDLETDPYELDNRIGDRKAPLERMKRLLHGQTRS